MDVASNTTDWEALWRDAGGPASDADDLALAAEIFNHIDRNQDGLLEAAELRAFRSALIATSADWLFDTELVDDSHGSGTFWGSESSQEDAAVEEVMLDPSEWVAFHAAAASSFGLKRWHRALASAAAVCRITREAPTEEPWVVCVGTAGGIMSSWFSKKDMLPDERAACRALKDAGRWRCLSCEAEALNARQPLALERAVTHAVPQRLDVSEPPRLDMVSRYLSSDGSLAPSPAISGAGVSGNSVGASLGASLTVADTVRCGSLGQMLSHRALRPVRKRTTVGDRVIIETAKGTARPSDLGSSGCVTEIYIPEKVVVREEWCRVTIVQASEVGPKYEVIVPLSAVANLKVPLLPGDIVQAYRPITEGRLRGQRSTETAMGTVLGNAQSGSHLLQVSFRGAESDVATIPLSWILRAEMSAWTQVLRSAPRSTLIFLLCDLCLLPNNSHDADELDNRLRRDFEPHGRCRYIGDRLLESMGTTVSDGAPEMPSTLARLTTETGAAAASMSYGRGGTTWLANGDCGKILSFNHAKMEVVFRPDRKKHMRLKVAISALEPVDDSNLVDVATSGPASGPHTTMHAFDEDSPLMAAVKRCEAREVRKILDKIPRDEMVDELVTQNTDADGNTLFHAAVYEKSEEMWRILWGTLDRATFDRREVHQQVLSTVND